jgi:hypothetical protein
LLALQLRKVLPSSTSSPLSISHRFQVGRDGKPEDHPKPPPSNFYTCPCVKTGKRNKDREEWDPWSTTYFSPKIISTSTLLFYHYSNQDFNSGTSQV